MPSIVIVSLSLSAINMIAALVIIGITHCCHRKRIITPRASVAISLYALNLLVFYVTSIAVRFIDIPPSTEQLILMTWSPILRLQGLWTVGYFLVLTWLKKGKQ